MFFLRIWRRWLKDNSRSEKYHFVTNNAYVCVEINAHMMLQLIYNVINGVFPPEVLRVWNTGSQGCVFGIQVHRVACLEYRFTGLRVWNTGSQGCVFGIQVHRVACLEYRLTGLRVWNTG